jgi:ketosteroid isomerase-like protein
MQASNLVEQAIIAREQEWMEAWRSHDLDACAQILADDFTITSALSTGELADKAQWLALAAGPYKCESFIFHRLLVRVYGNVAVVNAWYSQKATARGQDWSGDFLLTDVWVDGPQGWQVVTGHSSHPLPRDT